VESFAATPEVLSLWMSLATQIPPPLLKVATHCGGQRWRMVLRAKRGRVKKHTHTKKHYKNTHTYVSSNIKPLTRDDRGMSVFPNSRHY